MAKWLTRWSAKPVFMGSNPIRCSNNINSVEGNSETRQCYCSGKCSECRAFLCSLPCSAECNQFCHLVQRYASTKCKAMLPSKACGASVAGVRCG